MIPKLAELKYPEEVDPKEALGKLARNYLLPYLLWHVPPLRALYETEWDYVLYLLGLNNENGENDELLR